MKFTIFYFSGTGNTKWVVDKLCDTLENNSHETERYAVELEKDNMEVVLKAIEVSDFIGFAYPVYGANIPRIMRVFIERFIEIVNTSSNVKSKLFLINTFAYVNGHGIFEARKLFEKCSMTILLYTNFRLTNSAPNKTHKKALFGESMPDAIKKKAYKKINYLVECLEKNKENLQGIGPHLLVGKVIRRALKNEIRDNYINMHVNMQDCIKCMKCVKDCPTNSIIYENDKFLFLMSCETCMRCYNFCPNMCITNTDEC